MKLISKLILMLVILTFMQVCYGQETILYKKIDTTSLYLETRTPEKLEEGRQYPALVFFFGGGWKGGNRYHFEHHAEYFAKRGMVCFLVDYRIENVHGTSPFVSLTDAKSAIRFIRENAELFNIDPERLISCGGSAGGHLAAATALVDGFNDPGDNPAIGYKPNSLVLFNPVFDNGPGGYGYERVGEAYKDFSPLHNIREGAPPTIVFLGTEDRLIPVETAVYYKTIMERVGSRCELKLYEGQGHGFFNYRNFDNYKQTLLEMDAFLQELGYLKKEPVIEVD